MEFDIHKRLCKEAIHFMKTELKCDTVEDFETMIELIEKLEENLNNNYQKNDYFMPVLLIPAETRFIKKYKLDYIFQTKKEKIIVTIYSIILIAIFLLIITFKKLHAISFYAISTLKT